MLLKIILITFSLILHVHCLENGLARTPPMGWISWEAFHCNLQDASKITEQLYKAMADRFVSDGFKDLGYEYINIDDCWSEKERDPTTHKLVADKKRFPDGITGLAEYIHSKGLKLGIYGDVGPLTCAKYPAQNGPGEGYFDLDAKTFAEWKVDSFKFDGCNEDYKQMDTLYPKMERALNASGRAILFSCEWPLYQRSKMKPDYVAIAKTCNTYRNHGDVSARWTVFKSIIDDYGTNNEEYSAHHGPGHWFDPDMVVIGLGNLTIDQCQTQMAMWSIWAAPLYMSNDLRTLKAEHKKILQNKKVIAVNQDKRGIMGKRVIHDTEHQVWVKPLEEDSYAVVYLRDTNGTHQVSHTLKDILPSSESGKTFDVSDLFADSATPMKLSYTQSLTLSVDSYGVKMLKLVPEK